MARGRIPAPVIPKGGKLIAKPKDPPKDLRWSFSFRFWNEHHPYFGLGAADLTWVASLLGRLSQLSTESIENIWTNHGMRSSPSGIHFHQVDFLGKNVPLQREDFDWLPDSYRLNSEEFTIYQFHVSTAMGRVIGFFDETWVFNVLLLDPKHNLQPSKFNSYQLTPSPRVGTHQAILLSRLDAMRALKCSEACPFPAAVANVTAQHLEHHLVFLRLDESEMKVLNDAIRAGTFKDASDALVSALSGI